MRELAGTPARVGRGSGPNLDEIAVNLSEEEIHAAIGDHPDNVELQLSEEDFDRLVSFLGQQAGASN